MALFSREFIAVPDDRKGQIVFKWPDVTIRRFTHAIVNADEVAMFVNTGQVVQTMGPGRHQIDANELPGLGALIDFATGGNAYRAELYFIGTREYQPFKFGGRIDDVQDPRSGLIVTLRVFGDYALRVMDPAKLITNLTATVDVTDNERIAGWVSDQLLKVLRTNVTTQVVANGWPILGLSVHSPEIEQAALTSANGQLEAYGVALTRMGNFDINLAPEDAAQLKQLAKDTSYSQLAGGFQQYAAGEMALGAGQGMAQGGGAVQGAFLAAGLGLGQQVGAPPPGAGAPPPPAPGFAGGGPGFAGGPGGAGQAAAAGVTCASCGTANAEGAKFCANCGTSLAPPTVKCPSCSADNPVGAKFCSSCGTSLAPAACASCGTELAAGAKFCASCGTPVGAPAAAAPPAAG